MAEYQIKTGGDGHEGSLANALSSFNQGQKEEQVAQKAQKAGMHYVNLLATPLNPEHLTLIPHDAGEKAEVVCYLRAGKKVKLALVEPERAEAQAILAELKEKEYEVEIALASEESVNRALQIYAESLPKHEDKITSKLDEGDFESFFAEIQKLKALSKDLHSATSAEAMNRIYVGAIRTGASDIHFQPEETAVTLYFRIDGVMQEILKIDFKEYLLLCGQMKHDAKVKINVTNVPQDGELAFHMNERRIDLRFSSIPTQYGETIVLRVLDSKKGKVDFGALGFNADNIAVLERTLKLPNGMILTTGPTGSGKTTTLYALLNKLNNPENKALTLEDPVEYHLEGVAQSQINEAEGYTFADGIKAALRQDPDIILVGEIRDGETAVSAVQASLTGHIVLSTLHANSAIDTLPRLINLGIAPFLLAPSISLLVGQRLVREVCPHCAVEREMTEEERAQVDAILEQMPENIRAQMPEIDYKVREGKGCEECSQTGYKGRSVIAEMLEFTPEVRKMILKRKSTEDIYAYLRENGMRTLLEDGLIKVLNKKTTLAELIRIAGVK